MNRRHNENMQMMKRKDQDTSENQPSTKMKKFQVNLCNYSFCAFTAAITLMFKSSVYDTARCFIELDQLL